MRKVYKLEASLQKIVFIGLFTMFFGAFLYDFYNKKGRVEITSWLILLVSIFLLLIAIYTIRRRIVLDKDYLIVYQIKKTTIKKEDVISVDFEEGMGASYIGFIIITLKTGKRCKIMGYMGNFRMPKQKEITKKIFEELKEYLIF